MNFSANGSKKCLVSWKSTKNHRFGQTLQLFEQTTMFWHFDELFRKKIQKVARFVKKHEHSSIWPKLATSRRNYHVFAFRSTFREKVAKSASFRETARKIIDLGKALQLLEQATMSFSFWWTFKKKVAKSASSREKAPKIIDFLKLQLSEKTTMFWRFDEHCSKKLQKAARAVKKHEKSSIWPNLCNFSNKLRCFCISMNFQGKSCQKWPVSWKSTNTHRFGQNLQLSKKLPCFGISMKLLQEKVAKRWKKWLISWKIHRFGENFQLFANYHVLAKLFSKKLQKDLEKPKHRFGQNLQLFRTNYHVLAFRWTFQEKVAKSASFREKARKIIDLAKALQLLEQATMSFSFWWTFKKKVAKSASSREKAPKIIDFLNLQLSEKTTMFWRFDEHCSKMLQKAARAVKKHEKSSIWPNLCNFSNKLRCFCISMNFQGKSCQKCFVSWKSTKNHRFGQNFATFRANYHVLAFRWSFSKKLQKVPHFVKKHEKSSIWRKLATFPTNYHVLTLWWTFQRKVAESTSFSEKTLKIIDWAKTCNFF